MSKRVDMKPADAANMFADLLAKRLSMIGRETMLPHIVGILADADAMGVNMCAREGTPAYPAVLATWQQQAQSGGGA